MRRALHLVPVLVIVAFTGRPSQQALTPGRSDGQITGPSSPVLLPTVQTPLPSRASRMWFGPSANDGARAVSPIGRFSGFVRGVRSFSEKKYAQALPFFSAAQVGNSLLADYGLYYAGLSQIGLEKFDDARRTFAELRARAPQGYLSEAAALREGEAAERQRDYAGAIAAYEGLTGRKTVAPDDVFFRLGRTYAAAGDRRRAVEAYRSLYFRFPQSLYTSTVESELTTLGDPQPAGEPRALFELNLGRAERLFAMRQYVDARSIYEVLRKHSSGDEREIIDLRLGECDYFLGWYESARDHLAPHLDHASRAAEAQFFYLTAIRELRRPDEYVRRTRRLIDAFPDSSWAEEALSNLATHYIKAEDLTWVDVFREQLTRFPSGPRAERAFWKLGWWAYENSRLDEAIRVFERAAAEFPRSDNRPAYLYWAGRAHQKAGRPDEAAARYEVVRIDYQNSYYGRLAAARLRGSDGKLAGAPGSNPAHSTEEVPAPPSANTHVTAVSDAQVSEIAPAPTEGLVRLLLSLELYDDAMNELVYLQRTDGDSPAVQATIAWVQNRRGELRRAVNTMKRAYPQYIAAGGERLPADILKVLFPLDYWDLIRKHATAQGLDPCLVAALVAQESTFLPAVKSSANAYGLMQIVPATGRRIARALRIKRFSTKMLTDPETNIRIGTTYFARLTHRLGEAHLALAGYNAGESRVVRWVADKPGLERDEFIDAIPFPETQNYVKRILGTAEDYRKLYGETRATPDAGRPSASSSSAGAPGPKAGKTGRKKVTRKAAPKKKIPRAAKKS